MPRQATRITDLSPAELAEWKPLIDEQLRNALSLAEIQNVTLRSENAELRQQLADAQAEIARLKSTCA